MFVIRGFSLLKGIGDSRPVASERFTVGGHQWVLLFYPDGHRGGVPERCVTEPPPDGSRLGYFNGFAAIYVSLVGEGPRPQGMSEFEAMEVRAFHRFTLVAGTSTCPLRSRWELSA